MHEGCGEDGDAGRLLSRMDEGDTGVKEEDEERRLDLEREGGDKWG